jgi:hypothetical protein
MYLHIIDIWYQCTLPGKESQFIIMNYKLQMKEGRGVRSAAPGNFKSSPKGIPQFSILNDSFFIPSAHRIGRNAERGLGICP